MTRTLKAALQAALSLVTAGCAGVGYGGPRRDPRLAAAWPAWERGDFAEAARRGVELAAQPKTADAGHFVLALVAHARGDHAVAIAEHRLIRPGYR
jgi:hypothetical protein